MATLSMTNEQMQNELNYSLALKLIQKMLAKGIISQDEFSKIDELNRVSFAPRLAKIMPCN